MTSAVRARRRNRPRHLWAAMVGAVFAGGCLGGLARYEVTLAWPPSPHGFPWATFAINTSGAFGLALLLVLVNDVLPPTTYVRPLLGTGFCGAWTTFSSIVAASDQLVAHGDAVTGILYLIGSAGCGLMAATAGLVTGRFLARHRDGSA